MFSDVPVSSERSCFTCLRVSVNWFLVLKISASESEIKIRCGLVLRLKISEKVRDFKESLVKVRLK